MTQTGGSSGSARRSRTSGRLSSPTTRRSRCCGPTSSAGTSRSACSSRASAPTPPTTSSARSPPAIRPSRCSRPRDPSLASVPQAGGARVTVRLASFNVENLFDRAKALATPTWAEGRPALAAFERFNVLAAGASYSDADKAEMLSALETLQILKRSAVGNLRLNTNPFDAWALLRENRGDFLGQPRTGSAEVVALGRGDWIGWVELISEPVDETAIRMTAGRQLAGCGHLRAPQERRR